MVDNAVLDVVRPSSVPLPGMEAYSCPLDHSDHVRKRVAQVERWSVGTVQHTPQRTLYNVSLMSDPVQQSVATMPSGDGYVLSS